MKRNILLNAFRVLIALICIAGLYLALSTDFITIGFIISLSSAGLFLLIEHYNGSVKFDFQFVLSLTVGLLFDHKDKELYILLPGMVIEIIVPKKKKKNTYKT